MRIALVVAVVLFAFPVTCWSQPSGESTELVSGSQIVVVYGTQLPFDRPDSGTPKLAAEEMAKYVGGITGAKVQIRSDSDYLRSPGSRNGVIVIGGPEANLVAAELESSRKAYISRQIPACEDGFAIASASVGNLNYLVLAGNGARANFYAVYRYLEKFCNVGFFRDGERVPNAAGVPFRGVSLVDKPKFPIRANYGGNPTVDDWLLKKGFNYVFTSMIVPIEGTEVVQGAFPEVDLGVSPPKSFQSAEYDYARARGLKFFVQSGPLNWAASWPKWNEAFLKSEAFGPLLKAEMERLGEKEYWTPNNKMFRLFHDRMYSYIVKNYFGDNPGNVYWVAYGVENSELRHYDPIAVTDAYHAFKAADPSGLVFYDTWHPYTQNYSRDEFKIWDNAVPKGVHIADSGAYGGGTFGRYENFYGRKWILDFIYILGPTKQLQATPNLGYYKNLICRAAEDPDFVGNWCRPESQLTNVVLEEWLAALFWDPFKVSEQQFLEDYVVRRFGAQSMDNMLASAQEADWAMSYGKAVEYYCSIGSYWHPITFPYILLICDEDDIRRAGLGAESMERSLELALAESADQAGNPLYDYYLEHVFLTYCSRMYLLSLRSLSEAYYDEVHNNGGSQARRRFEQEGSKLVRTCELMARGLSADPNYSVYASNRGGLDDAFSSGYWGNVFFSEVIRLKYRPLAQGMVDWLRQRLNSGNTSLPTVGEIEPVWIKARQDGIAAAKAELASYSAPTVWPPVAETVRSAFEEMKLSGCSAAAYADRLQTPRKHSWLVFSRFGHSPAVEVGAPEPIYDIIDGLGRTEYLYDFGPGRSVRNDFKMVHPTMAYSRTLGYGWENTNGLDGWDSAYPDDLQGDFIYGFAPRTFRVDLPNGRYQVTVFSRHTGFQMGEQRHGHYVSDPSVLRVISDGRERLRMSTRYEVYSPSWLGRFPPELKLDDQFKSGNFEVEVKDGKLRLTFSSPNSIPWTVSGLAIVPVIGKD